MCDRERSKSEQSWHVKVLNICLPNGIFKFVTFFLLKNYETFRVCPCNRHSKIFILPIFSQFVKILYFKIIDP